ncbi:TPA: hypothetical protein M4K80_003808 [Salmonella enterica]|nr:hypothetical protein [Salmonella enterica]
MAAAFALHGGWRTS